MVAPVPVRYVVLFTALLVCSTALAGCHDLPNTFSDNGLDPAEGSEDTPDLDGGETGDETDEGGDDGQDTGGEDGEDGGGDDEGEGGGDDEDDDGDDGGDGEGEGDEDNGTDEQEPPEIERGDFEADETITITASSGATTFCSEDDFNPEELEIQAGQSVNWRYDGPQSHAVHGDCFGHTAEFTDQEGEDHSTEHLDEDGSSDSFRFNTVGVYEYQCGYHPAMTGTVVVVEE